MKRFLLLAFSVCFSLVTAQAAWARDISMRDEIDVLKQRIEELEAKVKEQEEERKAASTETAAAEKTGQEEKKEGTGNILDTLSERFGTLALHGGVVGYYQGASIGRIAGQDFDDPNGAGFAADLELTWEPIKQGIFLLRIHAGEGSGADKDLSDAGALFANLNTIADDNPGDDGVSVLEAFYTHSFTENFSVSIGKTEPFAFIDDNAFANDENTQFVGKPFVNNPVLDTEDEYAPIVAVQWSPMKEISLTAVTQSSSFPRLDEDAQKDKYDNVFDHPFVGLQAAYSPEWNGLKGNYRVYGWSQTYDHPRLASSGTDPGWGIGLSLDQQVMEKLGLFARVGYQNNEVYEVPWFWSLGANLKGIIPTREEDELGLGVAGLKANDDLESNGTELHLETYYRIALTEHLAISPDLQCVVNPLGDGDNDAVFAGMLRGEWTF